jgi:hypothetical protein
MIDMKEGVSQALAGAELSNDPGGSVCQEGVGVNESGQFGRYGSVQMYLRLRINPRSIVFMSRITTQPRLQFLDSKPRCPLASSQPGRNR